MTDTPEFDGWIRDAVERYQRPLLSYAGWLLRDADKAADAVADTFARLCRQRPDELRDRLPQWLFTVCRRRAIDTIRRDRAISPLTDATPIPPATGTDPERLAERADDHAAALRAIERLPANQQEVVRLKFGHDLSYRQIAEVTGLSLSNVGYLLHVALKRIRVELSERS